MLPLSPGSMGTVFAYNASAADLLGTKTFSQASDVSAVSSLLGSRSLYPPWATPGCWAQRE